VVLNPIPFMYLFKFCPVHQIFISVDVWYTGFAWFEKCVLWDWQFWVLGILRLGLIKLLGYLVCIFFISRRISICLCSHRCRPLHQTKQVLDT